MKKSILLALTVLFLTNLVSCNKSEQAPIVETAPTSEVAPAVEEAEMAPAMNHEEMNEGTDISEESEDSEN